MRLLQLFFLASIWMFAQQARDTEKAAVLPLRLELTGFSPSQITVPAGRYEIRVINAAVLAPITVQLDDDKAAKLADVRSLQGAAKSRLVVTLKEGRHRVSVVGREQWSVEILVSK